MNPHLLVATPMYGGQCYGHYMSSVLALQNMVRGAGWLMEFRFTSNEALITRARNTLTEQFLASGASHLLFLDGDMLFNPGSILELVRFDVDVVGGVCAKKIINWTTVRDLVASNPAVDPHHIQAATAEVCVNYLGGEQDFGRPGLVEVKHIGTGCLLIKREVFERLAPHTRHFVDVGRDGLAPPRSVPLFWDCSLDEGGHYLSEDYHFCASWRAIGGKVFAAYNVRLQHVGTHVFG